MKTYMNTRVSVRQGQANGRVLPLMKTWWLQRFLADIVEQRSLLATYHLRSRAGPRRATRRRALGRRARVNAESGVDV